MLLIFATKKMRNSGIPGTVCLLKYSRLQPPRYELMYMRAKQHG